MNALICVVLLSTVAMCVDCIGDTGKVLMPGFKVFSGTEHLKGGLVFFIERPAANLGRSEATISTLFRFNLESGQLIKIVDVPDSVKTSSSGRWAHSPKGRAFSVYYSSHKASSAFVFSEDSKVYKTLQFVGEITASGVFDEYVCFLVRKDFVSKIWVFDGASSDLNQIQAPDEVEGIENQYGLFHRCYKTCDCICFDLILLGGEAQSLRRRNVFRYRYELKAKSFQRLEGHSPGESSLELADGRSVFFAGASDPISGTKLMIGNGDGIGGVPRTGVRLLKKFSTIPKLGGGRYWLEQVSPCGRFALVRLGKPATTRAGDPCYANVCYLVDLESGQTREFIDEEVERIGGGYLRARIIWVE